jgi:predicted secreted protein
MSSDFFASEEPRGSAEPAKVSDPAEGHGKGKRRRLWRSSIVAGVAAAAMAGGAGVAVAVGSSGTPANAATAAVTQVQSPVPTHPGMGGMGHWMPVLHGQAVLSKPGGGYQTVAFQRGTVTAVSTGSITVKSTDGFTQTYTINGSTVVGAHRGGISSVKDGNTASVLATVSGKTFTAARIIDWTLVQHSHMMLGSGH